MTAFPLVSVIIPAYNAAAFIRQTLESVLAQTYPHFEVIVVDDGSRDRTAEIVDAIAQQDDRIRLFRQQNAGVAAARNFAIANSSGVYIAPIDADDIWYPQRLERQVECIEAAGPEVGLVYSWSVYIDETGEIIGRYPAERLHNPEGEVFAALVCTNFLDNASTALFRRSCINAVGGYNRELRDRNAQGCEDWDLYLRIAEKFQFRCVPEYLIGYRQYAGSMATNCPVMARSYQFMMEDVQQRRPNVPSRFYQWSHSTFYNYLMGKSYVQGDYRTMLFWFGRCVQIDPFLLLRPGLYKAIPIAVLGVIGKPIASRIWKDHRSWTGFKERWKPKRRALTIDEINAGDRQSLNVTWRPYDWVMRQRWAAASRFDRGWS